MVLSQAGSSSAMSDDALESKLAAQLEFYFSDANVRRDKHLASIIGAGDATMRGWMPLADLVGFRRAAELLEATDASARLDAARRAVARSPALELDGGGGRVRRTAPYEAADEATIAARTVYVEPLDPALDDHDAVRARFAACGRVVHVALPTGADRARRGFGFVEFADRAGARAAVERCDGAAARPGAPPTKVVTKLEWAALRRRWNDLFHNPTFAQARRRARQEAESGAPAPPPKRTKIVPGARRASS